MTTQTAPKPRIYFGWFILASCFILMAIGMSARNAFGLFLKPMIEDFQLSRAALSLPVSLSLILFGVSQPIGGLLIRRFGARTVIIWGAALTCAGLVGMGTVRSIWGVYLFFGLLVGMVGKVGDGQRQA
ncbi:MAG: MFS transporter, partial [Nitrospinota bacterium]